jgi:RNA polymerase sigma-B factor
LEARLVATTSPPFDRKAEEKLLVRYHRDGDLHARDELTRRLMPLARDLAGRYANSGEPLDDLTQVAYLGLLKAVDRYELNRGTGFVAYAVPTIRGELKRHFRDKGWAMHVPRDLQERALAVRHCRDSMAGRLGRSPTVREAAAELGWSSEQVLEATLASNHYSVASLDAPPARDTDDAGPLTERLGSTDRTYSAVEDRELIAGNWKELSDLERQVVRLRIVDDLPQREIGRRVGFSQMHVSRVLRRALERLAPAA